MLHVDVDPGSQLAEVPRGGGEGGGYALLLSFCLSQGLWLELPLAHRRLTWLMQIVGEHP